MTRAHAASMMSQYSFPPVEPRVVPGMGTMLVGFIIYCYVGRLYYLLIAALGLTEMTHSVGVRMVTLRLRKDNHDHIKEWTPARAGPEGNAAVDFRASRLPSSAGGIRLAIQMLGVRAVRPGAVLCV